MIRPRPARISSLVKCFTLSIFAAILISSTAAGSTSGGFSFIDSARQLLGLAKSAANGGAPGKVGGASRFKTPTAAPKTAAVRSRARQWLAATRYELADFLEPSLTTDLAAGTALQFNGVNQHVTFGDTRLTAGTFAASPTWNTSPNSKFGASSLTFNGTSQYVTFGNAAELRLSVFTIETWFYRTGAGVGTDTSGSGGGGLQGAIPLVTKGRGEGDYSNVDMNYFLGISSGGTIAADFEDSTSVSPNPNNHAIVGTTSIINNTWYHAAATFDGTTFAVYLNGNLEASVATSAIPRSDSIQHAGLATGLNSTGTAAGFFAGRLDEARIWSVARSQTEIQSTMNSQILDLTPGLAGRWGLNDASGTTASNLNRLGATSFTLEAWVNRGAGGATMSTGSLGLDGNLGRPTAYPVLAKGMGEGETPANINTNWFLGITSTGVIGADFEDTAGGVNHPAWGTTSVPIGEWHHIAATYTGSCWAIYLDGVPDALNIAAATCPNATPESTSYQRAGLSAGINSTGGLGTGFFSGAIDEARVWNRALSPAEVLANKGSEVTSGSGLLARWGINEGAGTATASSVGTFSGTLTNGPLWIAGFPLSDTTAPAEPTGLFATGGDTVVSLTWTPPADPDVAGYNVYRSESSPVPLTSPINGVTLINSTSYIDTGRVNGTTYYYAVTAVDTSTNESIGSVEANATPFADITPPADPLGLSAVPDSMAVSLNWTENTEGDLAGYNVYRSTSPSVPLTGPVNGGTLVTGNAFSDTGLTNGQIYYYVVTAVDASTNESGASNEVSATPAQVNAALLFDGVDDYVAFGNPPGLGVQNFTIETWFKWTGGGVTASTGTNGIVAYPLVTKGLHQSDGSNVDANYFLGINTAGKLAADFEEYGGGQNYPVTGNLTVTTGTWHHVAATYDGQTWKLYLDGNLDASLTLPAPHVPRYDSIQKAGIGAAMDSGTTVEGRFAGTIDEVRIWNLVRSQSEIFSTINSEISSGTGLVARWGINEGTGTVIDSSVGTFTGTLINGPVWVVPGAPFNITLPGVPTAPTLLAATPTAALEIDLAWSDNSSDESSFKIERSLDGSTGWSEITTTPANVAAYTDNGLVVGTQYCYRVRASNFAGDSDYSNVSCATTPGQPNNGLNLGTGTAYVSFGDPSALDLPEFTIETWFKRTGPGTSNTTGNGGIANAIPLVMHGAPEAEGSSVDANWILAINDATDVIAADFEDSATGLNHPVLGTTPIVNNVWHHAAATYDGTTWRLYLDGNLEATLIVNAMPRSDSIQGSGLGAMFTSTGTALGHFEGTLDEARVWNYARTQSQIQGTVNSPVTDPQPGLVARWALDETSGTTVGSTAGTNVPGTIVNTGYAWVAGSPSVVNHAPGATLTAPASGATNVSTTPTLSATVTDADLDDQTVSFYGRLKNPPPGADFSIIALPDTQYYSGNLNGGTPEMFYAQTQWMVDNRATRNIAFATQLGDCVEHGDQFIVEWQRADTAFQIIENPTTTGLSNGIPYGIAPGNHDQTPIGTPSGTTLYNQFFGTSRFSGRSYYGGHYGGDNDNHYELFSASGLDFIIVHLEYDSSANPAVLAWADGLLQTYSNRRAIVVTHWLINGGDPASFSAQGQAIYTALKDNPNLFLMLGGHVPSPNEGKRTDTYLGNTVTSLMSDYQGRTNGGNGWMRIMTFSPANNNISVQTYSPVLSQFETDADSQFVIPYSMANAQAPYQLIGTANVANGGTASVVWNGLAN